MPSRQLSHRLLGILAGRGWLSLRQIHRALSGNVAAATYRRALAELAAAGRGAIRTPAPGPRGGRPRTEIALRGEAA
jgi:hypothetical protein